MEEKDSVHAKEAATTAENINGNDRETLLNKCSDSDSVSDSSDSVRRSISDNNSNNASILKKQESSTSSNNVNVKNKNEKKINKIVTRGRSWIIMLSSFGLLLYAGHIYMCLLVALCQLLTFRELVRVRYNAFFHVIHERIPLFRTTQWMWFFLGVFYTHSGFISDVIKNNTSLHYLIQYAQLRHPIAFCLYSVTFVTTIATLQAGHIRFQINQLCWTILVCCLILGQTMYIMHNIYNGLIWFTFPILLVVSNDSFAYVAGMAFGKRFTKRPLFNLSPNKTWEGFIGGWIGTVIFGWYASRFLSQYSWMTCPTNHFTFTPTKLTCDIDPIFSKAICLEPSKAWPFYNFLCEYKLSKKTIIPFQIHAIVFSFFASLVAPFGGFLASAIKRAYGVKDFDSIIPGHGGIMDRVDCQFVMALYVSVHFNTFVRSHTVSIPKMIYMFNLLSKEQQLEFAEKIKHMIID